MAGLEELRAALKAIDAHRIAGVTLRDGGAAGFVLAVDGLDQPGIAALRARAEAAARALPGVASVRIIETADRSAAPARAAAPTLHPVPAADVPDIAAIVAVGSGKGGVGKSTVAANLAVAAARRGLRVGLLDADIHGPSVPTLLGTPGRAALKDKRIQPAQAHGISAVSMGMMADPDRALAWRGPMAASAMMQLLTETDWGALDLLIVDLPPGTGDIALTMVQKMPLAGAVIVSTPQDLALIDARRAIALFQQVAVPVLGMIENMSLFTCPDCGSTHPIFGHGGTEAAAAALGLAFLGAVPLDGTIRAASDAGTPPAAGTGVAADCYAGIAGRLLEAMAQRRSGSG